jgi:hypothetical protein
MSLNNNEILLINNAYANEATPWFYMHNVALHESEVTDHIRESWSFLMCAEASITIFNSTALELDFTANTKTVVKSS